MPDYIKMYAYLIISIGVLVYMNVKRKKTKRRELDDEKVTPIIQNKYEKIYNDLCKEPEFQKFKKNKIHKIANSNIFLCILIFFGILFLASIFLIPLLGGVSLLILVYVLPIFQIVLLIYLVIVAISFFTEEKVSDTYQFNVFLIFMMKHYPTYICSFTKKISEIEYGIKAYVESYDSFESKYLFSYVLKGNHAVRFSQVKTVYNGVDHNGNRKRIITFEGLAGSVNLNGQKLEHDIFIGHNSKSNIKLDNEEFEKRYNVYAENEIEAYKFLTPTFMEKLINLDDIVSFDFLIEKDVLSFRLAVEDFFRIYKTEEEIIGSLERYDRIFKFIEATLDELIQEIEGK